MIANLLLVEDHDANRAVIKRRLERRGFVVNEACDGRQAIEKFQDSPPHLIIMDLSMPGMSGFEALEQIRVTPAARAIPAIALTAHAMESMRQKCADAGFEAFLTKPIDFDELVRCITELTQKTAA